MLNFLARSTRSSILDPQSQKMSGRIFGINIPFADLIGIEPVEQGAGFARTALDIKPELLNSWGVTHGGVVMTLLDLTLGMAARTLDLSSQGSITVEMKTNFIAAAKGGRISAEGRALPSGRSLVFCEGEVRDQSGAVLAKANGTFKIYRGAER
jgi:acyl-CoA thioesterase